MPDFQGGSPGSHLHLSFSEVWGPPEVLQFLSASIRKYDDVFLSNQFKAIAHSALSPE
jgi:hypothetical protein